MAERVHYQMIEEKFVGLPIAKVQNCESRSERLIIFSAVNGGIAALFPGFAYNLQEL